MKVNRISKGKWFDIISSPYIMALPIAVTIILFIPDIYNKYEVKLVKTDRSHKANSVEEYHDLDGDGYSERVIAYNNTLGEPAMQVLHHDGSTLKQWDFTGRYPERQGFLQCGDLNNDGIKEIYLFTLKSDTLLLHAIAPFTENVSLFSNKFITTIRKYKDTVQAFVEQGNFYDLKGDGTKELVFAVKAGFSVQPRGIYVYDPVNDSVYHSMMLGANLGKMIIDDVDDDGKAEIFCSYNTLENIHDSLNIPYNDYSAYFMGFDHRLNFLFPPIEYNVYPAAASIAEIEIDGEKVFALLFKNRSHKEVPSELKLINAKGEILKEIYFDADDPVIRNKHSIEKIIKDENSESVALFGGSSVVVLDQVLEINDIVEIEGANHLLLNFDLNKDGIEEMVFSEYNQSLLITQAGLKDPVRVKTFRDPFSKIPYCVTVKENGDDYPELFIKSDNKVYFYTYKNNGLYYLKYPIWLCIYFVILSIILLISYVQKKQLQRKMEMENRLNALQLKTIKSQMDPHFMFNALNSISINILNKQHDTAYRYMVKYSHLLRMLFTKADQLAISLEEELAFVEHYLELEQFRFKEKITYSIDLDPDTNQSIQLPRMFIQLFVENALKHGIRHKEEGIGHVMIRTIQKADELQIIIRDNGIGRQEAKKHKGGHGMGLKIIDEMIRLFEKVNGVLITYRYEDLSGEDGSSLGTEVYISIPL